MSVLFADDTLHVTDCQHIKQARILSQRTPDDAGDWFTVNKLKLNMDKTKELIFYTTNIGNANDCVTLWGFQIDNLLI